MNIEFQGSDEVRPLQPGDPGHGQAPIPPDIKGLSDEEIEQKFKELNDAPREPLEPLDESIVPEELDEVFKPKEVEKVAVKPEEQRPEAAASPEPTAESEPDLDKLAAEAAEAKRQAAEALAQARQSRLAGEIGFLRQKLAEVQRGKAEADYGTEPDTDAPARELQERLSKLEAEVQAEDVTRTIYETVASVGAHPDLKGLPKEDLEKLAAPYGPTWDQAVAAGDAKTARLLAEAVAKNILADAKQLQIARLAETKRAAKAEQASKTLDAKKAASIEQSSAREVNRRPRTIDDLSEEQQERLLDQMLRRGIV